MVAAAVSLPLEVFAETFVESFNTSELQK